MKLWKKITTLTLSAAMAASCISCGSSTANALTVNGTEIRAGIYIYYAYSAYYEALNHLYAYGASVDDPKVVENAVIDGVSTREWIQDLATEYCVRHVAILDQCEALNITLSEDELDELQTSVDSVWESYGEKFEDNGIGKQSIYDSYEVSYLENSLYEYYYGDDGANGVTEDALKESYMDNNARVRYVEIKLVDGAGNLLKSDGKAEMMEMAETFLSRLEECKTQEAMLEEFGEIEQEYQEYATSVSEEYAASTTDENGETATTTTTTTVATTIATETDENGDPVETTTTTTDPYAKETVIAKITTTTTKEPDPIVYVNGTTGTTTTTEPTYSPSKKAYDSIWEEAEIGVPYIIEDDEAYYILVRLDIEERMTEEDLWTETTVETVRQKLYMNAFETDVDNLLVNYNPVRNEKAYKRYNPLEIDFS